MSSIGISLRRSSFLFVAFGWLAALNSVNGQTPAAGAAAPSLATIEGVAFDSLHNEVLRGALLTVHGTARAGMTDAAGRFRIDSIPPGLYQVDVLHQVLDTIGIALRTPMLDLQPGKVFQLRVANPSPRTIVAARCTPQEMVLGSGAILGLVQYAESEEPAVGAEVALQYVDVRVSRQGIESVPRRRKAVVDQAGRFRICALPPETSGALTAMHGADTTGSIGVRVSPSIGIVGLELPDPGTSSRVSRTTVSGRVVDLNGAGLVRARVSVVGDSSVAFTDSSGKFSLGNLRPGTRMLNVRRLGFAPVEMPVALHSREPVDLTIQMSDRIALLDTVKITARRDVDLAKVGFTDRKRIGTGYYLGPDQVERMVAYDLPSLLASAPMLRRQNVNGKIVVTGRPKGTGNGCVTWYVDGMEWFGGGVEDFIRPEEVAAVEAYSANFTPPQFNKGISDCETVVIWTKQKIH